MEGTDSVWNWRYRIYEQKSKTGRDVETVGAGGGSGNSVRQYDIINLFRARISPEPTSAVPIPEKSNHDN